MANYQDSLMWKEINEWPLRVEECEKNLPLIKKIAEEYKKNNLEGIYTVARGTSNHAMLFLKYLFESYLGIPVVNGNPSSVTIYDSQLQLKNFLVIGCSQSGEAEDVLQVLRQAKDNKSMTVSITNKETSPLAKEANYHLYCAVGEEKSVAASKTFSAQLYLSYLLVKAFDEKKVPSIHDLAAKLTEAAALADKETTKMANVLYKAKECFVLGRGITSPLAFEAGLKLQETSYIHAFAYCSSIFYHGPMAMINTGDKVILLAPSVSLNDKATALIQADEIKAAKKMIELGADLLIVTDNPELFKGLKASCYSLSKTADEIEGAFYLALFIQMLACKVSHLKGLTPDKPRALKKVTITI
ncbi:MAG: SIS domain-containing protein [Bacilli bacterium]|jgi:glucosamine--fructose-6-phosphate aminotransferase (isomerizing)|nr:SIS domain-containing protein [Bacilli bacterium]